MGLGPKARDQFVREGARLGIAASPEGSSKKETAGHAQDCTSYVSKTSHEDGWPLQVRNPAAIFGLEKL